MKKKFLSILLALAMCLSLLPTAALADDAPSLAPAPLPSVTELTADLHELSAGVYRLSGNLTITQTIKVTGNNVILDLNGCVLKMGSSIYGGTATGSVIEVSSGKTLTLTDSNPTAPHHVYSLEGSNLWRWDESAEEQPQPTNSGGKTYSTVTGGIITGGGIVPVGSTSYGGGIKVEPGATLTMNGGNIIGCTSVCGGGVYVGESVNHNGTDTGGTFVMNGGSIIGCAAGLQGGGVFVYNGSSFTMNGGSIRHCICAQQETDLGAMCYGGGVYSSGTFTMKGGSIEDCDAKLNGSIQDNIGKADGKSIYLANKTLADILPDGYVLKSENAVIGKLSPLTVGICNVNVTAAACTHKDATNASTIGQNGTCSLCGGTCTHTLGAGNTCANCNKPLIAEVTSTTSSGGTATSYLAATGVTEPQYDVDDDFDLIADTFANSSTTKVKLLANVEATGNVATISFYYPNQTLDLNGHTLDSVGGSISLALPRSNNPPAPSLTITDSSTTKTGELKACVQVPLGSLTINSGTLTAKTVDQSTAPASLSLEPQAAGLTSGPIEITGASMTISGTAKVNCSTITVTGSSGSTARPGSLTVQDNAEITGGITVGTNGTLTMTGGTVQMHPIDGDASLDASTFLFVNGGTANISGGAIDGLTPRSGSVELSGGTYGMVIVNYASATDLLKNGYAYYAKASAEDTNYTKLIAPTTIDYVSMVENVAVKSHTCSFAEDPIVVGRWNCDCGRKATQEPIAYVDENGKTAYCTKYTVIETLDSDDASDVGDGWYVVSDIITSSKSISVGDFHLILKNNASLTLAGEIIGTAGKTLTIYGQPAVTGQITGKLTINADERYNVGGIFSLGSLTINGGDISVNASTFIGNSLRNDYGIVSGYYSVAVADKLTVNGGSLTVTAPGLTNIGSIGVYGVYADELTVNGGKITVTGGDITAAGAAAQVRPRGIFTHKLTMTGGDVSATAAAVKVTCNSTSNAYDTCESRSYGVYVESGGTGDGTASITGGKLTATGGNATIEKYAFGMTAESIGLCVSTLLVDGGTVEATGGNATLTVTLPSPEAPSLDLQSISCGLYANTTLKSGTITANCGTATATGSDNAEAEAWDLDRSLTMQGGTVTGSVLVDLSLTMTGGTMKLKENSCLGFAQASDTADLADLLPEGCAFYEYNKQSFATLSSGLTELNFAYVRPCTYTAESGTCPFCGKNFGSADPEPTPTPTPTPSNPMPILPPAQPQPQPEPEINVPFVDVTENDWFFAAIRWALANGITGGVDDTHFAPGADCTRSQIVTFLYRCAAARGVDVSTGENTNILSFGDALTIPEYAIPAFQWAVGAGIIQGANGSLMPIDNCTRAQIVTMLYRFAVLCGMDVSVGENTNILSFADALTIPEYAVPAFQWAVGAGIIQGADGYLLPDDNCTRAQIVTMLFRLLGE